MQDITLLFNENWLKNKNITLQSYNKYEYYGKATI